VFIVGVSFDDPDKNQIWAEENGYTYELWTDTNKTLALTYGSISDESSLYAGRRTVVLDPEGDLFLEYGSVDVSTSPGEVLYDLQLLLGG
jgi:peroxiredoxin